MATLKENLNECLDKNDCDYSWPDNTCFHPVLDLVRKYHPDTPAPKWFGMTSRHCMGELYRQYGRRWDLAGKDWFAETETASELIGFSSSGFDVKLPYASVLWFYTPDFQAVAHVGFPDGWPLVGIAGNRNWVHTKGAKGMLPLPADRITVVSAYQIIGTA